MSTIPVTPPPSIPTPPPSITNASSSNLIRGVSVYFLYLDTNKQTRAVEISEKFGWARRIDVKDKDTYEFSVIGSNRSVNIPNAPPAPVVSDSLDLFVDESAVIKYRFYTGPDIKSRISADGVYSPTEDEPDWWLLTRPGMVPHQPQSNRSPSSGRRSRRNSPPSSPSNLSVAGVPKSAKVRFHKEPTHNNDIEEIEIQFFV